MKYMWLKPTYSVCVYDRSSLRDGELPLKLRRASPSLNSLLYANFNLLYYLLNIFFLNYSLFNLLTNPIAIYVHVLTHLKNVNCPST